MAARAPEAPWVARDIGFTTPLLGLGGSRIYVSRAMLGNVRGVSRDVRKAGETPDPIPRHP